MLANFGAGYSHINTVAAKSSNVIVTNTPDGPAKIAGVKLIEALNKFKDRSYVSLMPTNLYGPNDNYDLNNSHVLPALIRKFHESKMNSSKVTLWGTGDPLREFLYVDDLAQAVLFSLTK